MDTNKHESSIKAFYALIKAGLWENMTVHDSRFMVHVFEQVDWDKVYQLVEEQSVLGVVLAGIEHSNVKPPQELLLQWIGEVQLLEQQNKAMNSFVGRLVEEMRGKGIYSLLLKGQGIAQCYERPSWRAPGDVDFLLSNENYDKAKDYLLPLASSTENEYGYNQHLGMTIEDWVVELHGSLRSGLSSRVDQVTDEIKKDVIYGGNVRSWINGKTQVFLLGIDSDIIFVFTHFLKHFYKEGLGLRQVCDWCRLLYRYRSELDLRLLESRIKRMGLMSEWKAFGAFAVEYLGMPLEAMPFYSDNQKWKKKADKICAFILEVGNMGHNRDMSYFEKFPYLIRKVCSMGRRCGDLVRHARIFPLDSLRFFPYIMYNGMRSAVRGE